MPPVLLRAIFNCHLWTAARLLPLLVGREDMTGIRAYTRAPASTPYAALPLDYIVGRIGRVVRRPWLMRDRRCLREGLLGYRFLSLAGYKPELRFGVDKASVGLPMLKAHCWVCLDGREIISSRYQNMVEVYAIPASKPAKVATA